MTLVAFLRHGPTLWNDERRLQGMTDVPLSDRGRSLVAGWVVPADMAGWLWQCSPLARAVETARLLRGDSGAGCAPALREMSFGNWEGLRLEDLRRQLGSRMQDNEARGIGLVPPEGESPRQVMARLRDWLATVAAGGHNTVAVSHKGIIRVVLAMATGWDMRERQPVRLDWQSMHVFRAGIDGSVAVERLNVPLTAAAGARPDAAAAGP